LASFKTTAVLTLAELQLVLQLVL